MPFKYRLTNRTGEPGRPPARNIYIIENGRLLHPGESCPVVRLLDGTSTLVGFRELDLQEGDFDPPPPQPVKASVAEPMAPIIHVEKPATEKLPDAERWSKETPPLPKPVELPRASVAPSTATPLIEKPSTERLPGAEKWAKTKGKGKVPGTPAPEVSSDEETLAKKSPQD